MLTANTGMFVYWAAFQKSEAPAHTTEANIMHFKANPDSLKEIKKTDVFKSAQIQHGQFYLESG